MDGDSIGVELVVVGAWVELASIAVGVWRFILSTLLAFLSALVLAAVGVTGTFLGIDNFSGIASAETASWWRCCRSG